LTETEDAMSRPGSEYERHVAAAAEFEDQQRRDAAFVRARRGSDGGEDDLVGGMSQAGRRADEWRHGYERGREGVMDRGRRRLSDAYGAASDWFDDYAGEGTRHARRSMRDTRHSLEDYFRENPLMVGAVGLGLGLLLGAIVPAARAERRALRPLTDDMRRTGTRYGAEAVRSVREEAERVEDEMRRKRPAGEERPDRSGSE
jgi:hypothetical protein